MIPKIQVLYIDDERNNLLSFRSSFRKDFNIHLANSGDEGMKILEENSDIHVVITDQRMPKTTGTQFLEKITTSFPKPMRVLLTGYSDMDAVIGAINKGAVYKYITKPWNQDEIRNVIQEAYKAYLAKEDNDMFVYKASHDLRSPLASIEGLLEVIKSRVDESEEIYRFVDLIDTSVNRVQDIMSELIEFKELGEVNPKLDNIDLKDCISKVKDGISFMDNFEKNKFTIEVYQKTSFVNDELILKSIIQNLVSNAVKYGNYEGERQAKIIIKSVITDTEAHIIVEDNGIGMKEEAQRNIFKMFYREGISNAKGSGLGMFITKNAINKLEGSISLKSEVGKGTTFTIMIPNKLNDEDDKAIS